MTHTGCSTDGLAFDSGGAVALSSKASSGGAGTPPLP